MDDLSINFGTMENHHKCQSQYSWKSYHTALVFFEGRYISLVHYIRDWTVIIFIESGDKCLWTFFSCQSMLKISVHYCQFNSKYNCDILYQFYFETNWRGAAVDFINTLFKGKWFFKGSAIAMERYITKNHHKVWTPNALHFERHLYPYFSFNI